MEQLVLIDIERWGVRALRARNDLSLEALERPLVQLKREKRSGIPDDDIECQLIGGDREKRIMRTRPPSVYQIVSRTGK